MAEEKFKLRLDLKSGNEEIDLYIYELHNYLVSFETSSIKQMLVALDEMCIKITDDIVSITNGNLSQLTVLSQDGQDKTFDRVMKIVEKIDSFKKVSEMAEQLRPEVAERKEEVKKSRLVIDTTANPFEQIQKEILEKGRKK